MLSNSDDGVDSESEWQAVLITVDEEEVGKIIEKRISTER